MSITRKILATATWLTLALAFASAEVFECQDSNGCNYQRIKDDGTLGPVQTASKGDRLVVGEGDFNLGEGWVQEPPPEEG